MLAGIYLTLFLWAGIICIRWLLPRHPVLNRVWLGASFGLLLAMWLPALCAFVMRYTMAAHGVAVGLLALICGLCFLLRDRHSVKRWDTEETRQLRQLLLVMVPLTLLSGYLQYTHNMRVDETGWYVGQSTYGDLPMHLSFITNLQNSAFPPDYPFYPGVQLSYPFLTDSLSTSLYMMGVSLQLSVIIPGTLMMALCYMGVMLLARDMTLGKKTIVLAALLFFLNGGLGFLYDFDMAGGTEYDGTLTVVQRVRDILEGYYKTPTNQPDPNNLRWSNVIADLMIPQRTLLGGWCMVIPCFYLLYGTFSREHRADRSGGRALVLLGIWGGALPLIHTHSFLALGLASLGMLLDDMIHDRERLLLLRRYLLYGCIAVALAAPQLVLFTFRQAFMNLGKDTGMQSFLSFHFNWVNNVGQGGQVQLRDGYLWFYVKNIGLPVILLLLALCEKDRRTRRIFSMALPIILAVELVRFQPNVYDNNKLMYLAWLLCCMIVADYAAKLWRRMQGLRGRSVMAAMAAVVLFLSAGLTLWRECLSNYQAYSAGAVEAGEWIRDHTGQDDRFLTGNEHLCPVYTIGGRQVVCGPDLWLYWHGIDTAERNAELYRFYTDPASNTDVLERYGVDYIYVSSYERYNYDVDLEALESLYTVVFSNREATIYRVAGD